MSAQDNTLIRVFGMALVLSFLAAASASADLLIIVNEATAQEEINQAMVKNVFLGRKTQWDNGDTIFPATLKRGPVHGAFLKSFVKKSPSQYLTFWRQVIFTGMGTPPKSFATEAELVDYVRTTSGAIGYIDSATAHEDVLILEVGETDS